MNIRQLSKEIEKCLFEAKIEQNEAKIEAKMLIGEIFGFSDTDFVLKDSQELDNALVQNCLDKAALRAATRKPIQHIIGYSKFMGENFFVDENVLIPRDETEILVRKCVELSSAKTKLLEIGVGSGCISCMLAKLTGAEVLGVDISQNALDTALKNVKGLNLSDRIEFRQSDLFENIKGHEKFDLIVSNPPYIPLSEAENLEAELEFEPSSALFANDFDGIEFYDKIIRQSVNYLKPNGFLAFELGVGQADLVKNIMIDVGFVDIHIEKDLARIERVIWGRK